jgi:ribosome-associated protein
MDCLHAYERRIFLEEQKKLRDIEVIKIINTALEDKFGKDIVVIDISKISILSEYFVITSGGNSNQVKALADEVSESLRKEGIKAIKTEGYNDASWILLDFDFVMIHIFIEEVRGFYNLEKVWAEGELIDVGEL